MNPHQIKRDWGYERSVPRCETCIGFKKPFTKLVRDSRPHTFPAQCKSGNFTVQAAGVCNRWRNQAGETLDSSEP